MKDYQIGEFYVFSVKGIGNQRIYLEDENGDKFSVNAYDFQADWDWSSPMVPVQQLSCYVKELNASGAIKLEQNRELLLHVLYPEASRKEITKSEFIVEYTKYIGSKLCYVLVDAYGLRHLYCPSEGKECRQPGDEVILNVKDIIHKENNRSYLLLSDREKREPVHADDSNTQPIVNTKSKPIAASTNTDDENRVGVFGEESDKVEFKSTIVYPASATRADIDTQMSVILRTIAGFLNANGGTLYIGVNDNGDPVGIEGEFGLLNTSTKDSFHYKEDKDGYENKLRTGMNALLGPVAQDYVHITFPEQDNHIICKVSIESSRTVIWFKEHEAFKRMGNRTTHLRSEAIVKLVLDKMGVKRPETFQIEPQKVKSEEEIMDFEPIEMSESTDVVKKVEKPAKLVMKGALRSGKGSFYMNLFSNGDWSWSKEIPSDNDLEFCLPVNSPASTNDLMMVYADGCVNRVEAYHLHLIKKENVRYMNGRRNDGARLLKVFTARDMDLLACFSTQNGHEFVKVHPVSHVTPHQNMSLMGNRLINTAGMDNVTMEDICFVSGEHALRVSGLFKTENQTSSSLGFQMDLAKNAKFLQVRDTLKELCDVPV